MLGKWLRKCFDDWPKESPSVYIVNGVTAFLFSSTGPVAIIIAVAATMGLSDQHVSSWLFAGFGLAGIACLIFSLYYKQPIIFAWTIPGTVLLLSALDHLSFDEVVGAYLGTGLLLLIIGVTGIASKIMNAIPRPVVMAMVAGIFLDFGLKLISAFNDFLLMTSAMVIVFIALSVSARVQRLFPPILGALIIGVLAVIFTDSLQESEPLGRMTTSILYFSPSFSVQAMIELVIPLSITVLMVQNGQGIAVLRAAGHEPPINNMTTTCGIGSLAFAMIGAVSMCVTGPSNAIASSSGDKRYQYIAAVTYGLLAILFGFFSGLMVWLAFKLPLQYIVVLGSLAVYRVLERSFVAAFSGGYSLGALTTLLVTLSDITIFNIGAPFWGLVFGTLLSNILEREVKQE